MNLRKGFFRLTLILSILIGIISAFVMMEREPYTRFKVRRAGGGAKELTITLLWFEERNPDIFDFVEAFQEAEKMNKKVIEVHPFDEYKISKSQDKGKGISPLVDALREIKEREEKKQKLREQKPTEDFIIEKTEKPMKWDRFFSIMGIGFISVWLVYVFIRWVIVAFIIGGFRHKTNS